MKLRTHILLLVVATVIPMVLFAAGLIFYNAQLQKASVERGMRDVARALTLALDRDIRDITAGVQTLAASRHLDDAPDLRAFYDEAATVSKSFGGWAVLSAPSGRQLINTSRAFGAELPVPSEKSLEMMRSVAASRRPFVSNLFIGAVSRRPAVIIIAVPVVRGDQARYVLDFPFEPATFTRLLQDAALSPGWMASVTDRDGVIVAWVPDTANFVGRPLPEHWRRGIANSAEGFLAGKGLSNEDVYAAYKQSNESGWVVAVAAPASAVEAPFRRSLLALSAGGVVLLAVACTLAFVLSRRIAGPIIALAASLKTPPDGRPARMPGGSPVSEVEELRRALEEAGHQKLIGHALREADRRKDEFLAMLSHELRNPLNAMLGWLRLLRGGTLDAAATRRGLDVIERSVNQQSRLIADLLDTSRIVAGKLTLRMEAVHLPALVVAVGESLRPAFDAKSVTLVSSVADDAEPMQGDPDRLRQVVENLLSNALKFAPEGGMVSLELAPVGPDEVRLTVSDTGAGIDGAFMPHIFERFRQGTARRRGRRRVSASAWRSSGSSSRRMAVRSARTARARERARPSASICRWCASPSRCRAPRSTRTGPSMSPRAAWTASASSSSRMTRTRATCSRRSSRSTGRRRRRPTACARRCGRSASSGRTCSCAISPCPAPTASR